MHLKQVVEFIDTMADDPATMRAVLEAVRAVVLELDRDEFDPFAIQDAASSLDNLAGDCRSIIEAEWRDQDEADARLTAIHETIEAKALREDQR